MSDELELHAEDWFQIKSRGWTCASFAGIPGFNPRTLRKKTVVIDGSRYRVLGVETHAVLDHAVIGKSFGLAVEAMLDQGG